MTRAQEVQTHRMVLCSLPSPQRLRRRRITFGAYIRRKDCEGVADAADVTSMLTKMIAIGIAMLAMTMAKVMPMAMAMAIMMATPNGDDDDFVLDNFDVDG